MEIELRCVLPTEYRATEHITREAFWNQYAPGCNEHYLLHIMRGQPSFVHELDVVAVYDGRIIGNVVYLKTFIRGDEGKEYEVLGLGPISVLPEYQGKGIGGKLIAHTKDLACGMGYRAIFLFGDPDYYIRHGFVLVEQFGIRTADNAYAAAHLVCELYENALSGVRGCYLEDAIFEIDATAADAFDKNFLPKEKLSDTPSQKRFWELVAMRKSAF